MGRKDGKEKRRGKEGWVENFGHKARNEVEEGQGYYLRVDLKGRGFPTDWEVDQAGFLLTLFILNFIYILTSVSHYLVLTLKSTISIVL